MNHDRVIIFSVFCAESGEYVRVAQNDAGPWWDEIEQLVDRFAGDVQAQTFADQRARAEKDYAAAKARKAQLDQIASGWREGPKDE